MSVSDLEAVLRRAACGMGLLRPSPPPYPPPAEMLQSRYYGAKELPVDLRGGSTYGFPNVERQSRF